MREGRVCLQMTFRFQLSELPPSTGELRKLEAEAVKGRKPTDPRGG
jgi:hypothetical protein